MTLEKTKQTIIENENLSFEDAIKRLNEISKLMEDPEITLKNAVELYSEANKLAEICNKNIKEAKIALEKIEE